MADAFFLRLKNDISELGKMTELLEKFRKTYNLSGSFTYDIKLSLEEIFSNIVFYGFDDGKDHFIDIKIQMAGNELILEIKDDGKPFNPLDKSFPDFEKPCLDRGVGGLGIYLVCKLMDNLEYKSSEGSNILRMKKLAAGQCKSRAGW